MENREITRSAHCLWDELEAYCNQGLYPFHMPGHKRRMAPAPGLPFSWDVTEVQGTDDLHAPEGILLAAMRRTAALWGADRTWYLVNGSTCGLLAGIRAIAPAGSEVIAARNCHKAVFHGLELAGYRVHWLLPPVDPDWGICGGISAKLVEKALREHPKAAAVILTSPTYEGILSQVGEICRVCHAAGIPVLVDEAHGAHLLPLSERADFPAGALAQGADIVVQSPHKTLPSLTQTALLHLKGSCIDAERIEEELDIFETSSPSYPLMASLDGCTGILAQKGGELFEAWARRLARFDSQVRALRHLRILNHTPKDGIPSGDPGKILIDAAGAGMTGEGLALFLRERYGMETEMASGSLVLAMTSVCDEEDALDRLAAALLEIDGNFAASSKRVDLASARKRILMGLSSYEPVTACTLAGARAQASEMVPLRSAHGRICAEYLYFYPPGIPFLAPGEIITCKLQKLIGQALEAGLFPARKKAGSGILCVRE